MNKERARELVNRMKELLKESDKHTLQTFNVIRTFKEEYAQALDIAIDSLDEVDSVQNDKKIKETLKNYIFLLKAISEATPGERVYQTSEVIAIIELIAKEIFDGKQIWDGTIRNE